LFIHLDVVVVTVVMIMIMASTEAGFLAALGAAWVRGEIRFQAEYWANWTAALLACITIFLASRSAAAPKLKQAV
jgi:hypothetical protein